MAKQISQTIVNDSHVHLGYTPLLVSPVLERNLIQFKQKYNINKMFVFPFETDVEETNKRVMAFAGKNRDRGIYAIYWIQKKCIEKDLETLRSNLGSAFIGVKFHGAFELLPITASVYRQILEFLDSQEAILIVHTGRYKDADRSSNTSYLHALDAAKQYRKIKLVMAHMGGTDTTIVKRALKDAADLENIFFDTSGITTPHVLEYAVRIIDERRIIFGSDFPWCSFRAMLANVEDSEIDEKTKQSILLDNFDSLISKVVYTK
ncbi:MAG TPA: amidohydrolase family protein [Nitrososphaeraceae archaeon]|nr:amidohydrolase family protein [Nitrososphaeraceae archaeon]